MGISLRSCFFALACVLLCSCSSQSARDELSIKKTCHSTCTSSLFSPFSTSDRLMNIRLGAARCIMLYDYFFRKNNPLRLTDPQGAYAQKVRQYYRWERSRHCQVRMTRYIQKKGQLTPGADCDQLCEGARAKPIYYD